MNMTLPGHTPGLPERNIGLIVPLDPAHAALAGRALAGQSPKSKDS